MKPHNVLKRIIAIAIFLSLVGCETPNGAADNKAVEERFKEQALGKNIDELLSQWGPTNNMTLLPSFKGKVYVWKFGECENVVTTDQYGVITEYSALGNCLLRK
jgi:hypothetical protein